MSWWTIVSGMVNVGDSFNTPGRGLSGFHSSSFEVIAKNNNELLIKSGNSAISLTEDCFDVVEDFFKNNPGGKLRVASVHNTPALRDSVDELVRRKTKSNLSRGNYVAAILEKCGLVIYRMEKRRKHIVLP